MQYTLYEVHVEIRSHNCQHLEFRVNMECDTLRQQHNIVLPI